MKRFNKIFSLAIVTALCIGTLAGCGNKAANGNDSGAKDANKEITLRFAWWGGDARHKATLDAINLYTSKHPNIKINAEYSGVEGYYQKLVTQLSGNTAPDIIQIDTTWIPELTAQGDFFADLTQFKTVDTSSFSEDFLKQYSYVDNKLIGLPTGINAQAMLINADFFNKFGIDTKTEWNWDNLLEIAKSVHDKDNKAYLINSDATNAYYLLKQYTRQITGGNWINDDYTLGFDKETITKSFDYLDKLYKAGAMQPLSETAPFERKPDQNPKWLNGETGMMLNWSSVFQANKANIPSLTLGMAPVAPGTKETGIVLRPSQLLTINKNSKNAEAAADFLNWFFNDKEAANALVDSRGVPATESARKALTESNKLDPVLDEATTAATKIMGTPENGISQNQEIEKISVDIIQQLAFGKLTPDKAADTLIDSYNQKLSELKAQK